jgi:hypothetical protein
MNVTEPRLQRCNCCLLNSESLRPYALDVDPLRVCDKCQRLLWAAETLWTSGVRDENEIIATLAFAVSGAEPPSAEEFAAVYRRVEFVRLEDTVPVVRLRPAVVETLPYAGHALPRIIRVEVLSKFANPADVAEFYRKAVVENSLPVFNSSPGTVSWDYRDARLVLDVGPREEIESGRLSDVYPQVYRFSFPMPSVVKAMVQALLGAPARPGTTGDEMLASGLGDHGRPRGGTPDTVILACVAWYAGECHQGGRPKDRRPRIARVLNRALLPQLGKRPLSEDTAQGGHFWEDAKRFGGRFDRARLFIQDDERERFNRMLRKAPV